MARPDEPTARSPQVSDSLSLVTDLEDQRAQQHVAAADQQGAGMSSILMSCASWNTNAFIARASSADRPQPRDPVDGPPERVHTTILNP